MSTIQTVEQALKALRPPLKFADEDQIRAVRFVEAVERCEAAILRCPENHRFAETCSVCDGEGEHECVDCGSTHECEKCNGSGSKRGFTAVNCSCTADFRKDVILQAIERIEGGR